MLSQSFIQTREADRARLAEAMERFLAAGGQAAEQDSGATAVRDGKQLMRAFKDTPPKSQAQRKPRDPETYRESVKRATFARTQGKRRSREELALKAAVYAGLGESMTKAAAELGVTRVTLRKACAEHNIRFKTQA